MRGIWRYPQRREFLRLSEQIPEPTEVRREVVQTEVPFGDYRLPRGRTGFVLNRLEEMLWHLPQVLAAFVVYRRVVLRHLGFVRKQRTKGGRNKRLLRMCEGF
jgi:hypothetical protein